MSPSDLAVREATTDDVSRLVALYRTAYRELAAEGFPSSMATVDAEQVESWLDPREVFVGELDGQIVGAVHLIPREEWPMPELGRLVVDPDHQQQGLGTQLLEHAEAAARDAGHDRLRIRTFSGHPYLGDWYRGHGYERVGIQRLEDRPFDSPILEREL